MEFADDRPQRESAQAVAVRRFETPIGHQAQVDSGHLGTIEVDGKPRPICGFTFTLGYSRAMMAEAALAAGPPEVRSTRKTRCASARAIVLIEHDPRPGYEPAPPFFIGLLASEFEETTFVVLDLFVDGARSIWGDP